MQLTGKAILVTGSTTGIGEAIARRAVQEGAQVMLHGRDVERGQALVAELSPHAKFTPGDLADPAVPQRLINDTIAAFGKLDALVKGAAIVRGEVG